MQDALYRRLWMRFALRGAHYSNRYSKMESLYRLRDPWNMDDPGERARFDLTNSLIRTHIGHVGTLLEIGCGEGHQSRELLKVCDSLHGIDVSRRAVKRAQRRCPHGTFSVGTIFDVAPIEHSQPVDLIVACEVLYYMDDIATVVERMSKTSRAWLATYYESQAPRLDPLFDAIEVSGREDLRHGTKTWRAVWRLGAQTTGRTS